MSTGSVCGLVWFEPSSERFGDFKILLNREPNHLEPQPNRTTFEPNRGSVRGSNPVLNGSEPNFSNIM